MTREEQLIDCVAGNIVSYVIDGLGLQGAELERGARRINSGEGWNFDVRWVDQEYLTDQEWTRVKGIRLIEKDLAKAIDRAKSLAGIA